MRTNLSKTLSNVGLCYFLYMVVWILAAIGFSLIPFPVYIINNRWFPWCANYMPLYMIALPLFLFCIQKKIPTEISPAPKVEKISRKAFFDLFVFSVGLTFLLNSLTMALSLGAAHLMGNETFSNPLSVVTEASSLLANILFVGIFAPIMEEIVFRKILYLKIGVYGGKTYIVVSGVLFALFHGNVSQLFYAFALGILSAFVLYHTGKVRYSILLHMGVNLVFTGGLGSIVNAIGNGTLMKIYLLVVIVLSSVGLIVGARYLQKQKYLFYKAHAEPTLSKLFFNTGMILYILFTSLIILSTLLL